MLLPPAAHRFPVPAGLRSLLVQVQAPDAAGRRVVTRSDTARCCRDVKARCDGTSIGHGGEGIKEANDDEDVKEEDEELDGFWVSYGRRCPMRRLPPPIPSLVARGALRRARTGDGRLVIRIVPVVRPERVRVRRRCGDSLTTRLVELIRHEDGVHDVAEEVAAPEPETTTAPVAVPPPRVSSVGCFEDVFRFDTIGGGSLHQMPSRLRMVH